MTEPERRRRRPAVSCSLCRKRKIRCNRETPCNNCVRSRSGTNCIYENHPSQPPRQRLGHSQTVPAGLARESTEPLSINHDENTSRTSIVLSKPSSSVTSASTPASQISALDVDLMKRKISELEEQLSQLTQTSAKSLIANPDSNIETTASSIGGTFHVHHESRLFGEAHVISRSVMHKTRLFGQSHWINGSTLFLDLLKLIEPHIREETSKASLGMKRCKSLAKFIKSGRVPPWPSPPSSDLPSREVADQLVNCYLRTTETVYRILHIPNFRRDYEALWGSDANLNAEFLIQLKLVFAIGATTYDEHFSLRSSAVHWVYEAQTWISEPEFKLRLTIQSLQTTLLLLIARETACVGGALIWISAGALLRSAMYMGLHRDPSHLPKRTVFAAEMRRRLWNTILEITLQSSMYSGGPPLITLEDFDTLPPGNFNDDQLLADSPVPIADSHFTQVSIAIALRKTIPVRLAIIKFLNDLSSNGTYEGALRLDDDLRISYKALCRTLQGYSSIIEGSPSQFEIHIVDFIMLRYLSSIHMPFFGPALHGRAYAFSRKVVVDTSLKIWCAAYPSTSIMDTQSRIAGSLDHDDFARFTMGGSGFFRTVAYQACFVIAAELKTQLQEGESLGPVPLRRDLLSVLNDGKSWNLQCIKAGETNIKGYLVMCMFSAYIDGQMKGLAKDELTKNLVRALEECEDICVSMLEEMAARGQSEGNLDQLNQMSSNTPNLMEAWDFIMSESHFNIGNEDPTSWMFNDEISELSW